MAGTTPINWASLLNPSSTQPAPYSQFGSVAYVNPTFSQTGGPIPVASAAQAPTYSANTVATDPATQAALTSQYASLNAASMAPTFSQQNQANNESLAARGIFNSGAAAQSSNDLQGQQAATLAGMNAPIVQQQAGYTQADTLANQNAINAQLAQTAGFQGQAGLQNQSAQDAANQQLAAYQQANTQYNATAANDAAGANAGAYTTAATQNFNAYNNWLSALQNEGANYGNTLLGSVLGSYTPNTSATDLLGQGLTQGGNAYNNALAGGAGYGSAFSNLFGNLSGGGSSGGGSASGASAPGTSFSQTGGLDQSGNAYGGV